MVYPHVHAMVKLSPGLDPSQLAGDWKRGIREQFPDDNVDDTLDIRAIEDRRGFMDCLGYLFKPVGILEPYANALACLDPSRVWELNQNVRSLLDLLYAVADECRIVGELIKRRNQVYYSGCMCVSSRSYVGAKDISSNRGEVVEFMGIGTGGGRNDVDDEDAVTS